MSLTTRLSSRRFVIAALLALALSAGPAFADRYDNRYEDHRRGTYNSEYIFVATKAVADMDVHPVAKVPLFPVTLVLDLVALPVEMVAGFF